MPSLHPASSCTGCVPPITQDVLRLLMSGLKRLLIIFALVLAEALAELALILHRLFDYHIHAVRPQDQQ